MAETETLGRWGERKAADWLRRRGYRILERNFRCRFGEIDLIAVRGDFLVFVEVKLRRDDRYGAAAEFVDARKQQRVRTAAELWLQRHPTEERQPRFDVIEVYAPHGTRTWLPKIRQIEDAFS